METSGWLLCISDADCKHWTVGRFPFPLLLGTDQVQISACFAKGIFIFIFFQMALIFSFSLSVCVRICFLLQQRSIANYTFEEEDLRDSAGNQRKQGYTSHCFLERVTSNSIWSFQAVVRCVYYKPVSYKANRIMRK